MFRKKEISSLIIAVIILGLIFGFNDGRTTFELNKWLFNLLHVTFLVAISLIVHIVAQKLFGSAVEADVEFRLWNLKRIGPNQFLPFSVPIGIIIAFFITIFSNGLWYFTGIHESKVTEKVSRVRKKFPKINEFEEGKILLAGPLANLGLILILNYLQNTLNINLSAFITINLFIVIFSMLPIPPLTGGKIFFYSRSLYVLGLSFIILTYAMMGLGIIPTILLGIILSLLITLAYFYYVDEEQGFVFPEFQQMKLFSASPAIKRWKFITLTLILMLILSFAKMNPGAVFALALIGAFIIMVSYNVLQKRN